MTFIERLKKNRWAAIVVVFVLMIVVGVFAENGWFPATDPLSGKKTGWFGSEPGAVATGFNQPNAPPPSGTPQLSKEYIYASGSRLLAVEDANANAAPPADLAVRSADESISNIGSPCYGLNRSIM